MSKFTVDLHPLKDRLLEALRPLLARQEEAWKTIELAAKEARAFAPFHASDFDVPALQELVMLLEDAYPYLLTMTFGIEDEGEPAIPALKALHLVEGGDRG